MLFNIFSRKKYIVQGEQGGLNATIKLPTGFDTKKDKCPLVILMHGFMASMNRNPIKSLAQTLADEGIASIRFDFNAHGKSEGKFINMTISNEISDAKAIMDYVKTLGFVTKIGIIGHSQGGVVASMMAGELEDTVNKPSCVVLLAPAAVLKDDAIKGTCMGIKYDPNNPPQYVNVWLHKLGRKFIWEAQKLPIYETAFKYNGPVCVIHGKLDKIVPYEYAEKYHCGYYNSQLHLIDQEGHFMNKKLAEISRIAVQFIKENLA